VVWIEDEGAESLQFLWRERQRRAWDSRRHARAAWEWEMPHFEPEASLKPAHWARPAAKRSDEVAAKVPSVAVRAQAEWVYLARRVLVSRVLSNHDAQADSPAAMAEALALRWLQCGLGP